jgi:hypothetical protein
MFFTVFLNGRRHRVGQIHCHHRGWTDRMVPQQRPPPDYNGLGSMQKMWHVGAELSWRLHHIGGLVTLLSGSIRSLDGSEGDDRSYGN